MSQAISPNLSDFSKWDRLLLQSLSGITQCDRLLYKEREVLQSVTSY